MSFIHDTWFIFRRQVRLILRNPAFLTIGLLQPILYLVLFGPLLANLPAGSLSSSGGTANAYRFFVPGLLIQLALFGSTFVGFAIISDWRSGVIERYRVTPVSRVAILAGRVLRDDSPSAANGPDKTDDELAAATAGARTGDGE